MKANLWPAWLAMEIQRWNCLSRSLLWGRCWYSVQVVSAAPQPQGPSPRESRSQSQADLETNGTYKVPLQVLHKALEDGIGHCGEQSCDWRSSLEGLRRQSWGSADVLDFNVPHVSSCCQLANAGVAQNGLLADGDQG